MPVPKVSESSKDLTLKGRRDAFHVPAILVDPGVGDALYPGDHVRFTNKELTEVEECARDSRHGIVDPFLKNRAHESGELVWIFLLPEVVSNLVHKFDVNAAVEDPIKMEEDESCRGCYGAEIEDEEKDESCKGCYGNPTGD